MASQAQTESQVSEPPSEKSQRPEKPPPAIKKKP